jgi:thioredoxin 1
MNDKEKNDSKKWRSKIGIPFLIILGIAFVWFIKKPDFLLKQDNISFTKVNEQNKSKLSRIEDTSSDFELYITEEIDLEKLKSYGIPIIIDFGSESCISCKEMAPILEKLNKELSGKAIIKSIDVVKYPEFAKDYPISVIPTQIFFDKEGNPYVPSDDNSSGMTMYTTKDTKEHVLTSHSGIITENEFLGILSELGLEE